MKRRTLNKILKNPMSITGDAQIDAQLNALLHSGDIEQIKQGLEISQDMGILEKSVDAMMQANVYRPNIMGSKHISPSITFILLTMQDKSQKTFGFWKDFELLNLSGLGATKLPNSIGLLKNITSFDASSNDLTKLPDTIGNLTKVEQFYVSRNPSLKTLPSTIGNLNKIRTMSLDFTGIEKLPTSISNIKGMDFLYIKETPMFYDKKYVDKLWQMLPNTNIKPYI